MRTSLWLMDCVSNVQDWWFRLDLLVHEVRTLKTEGYLDSLDNFILPKLWQQFGENLLVFQQDQSPIHKSRTVQSWFSDKDVEELDLPTQKTDL